MAELNLKQIADKLNTEFAGETRKLVFWYDENGDFADEITGLKLDNAKVFLLEPDNQFYTKYFLERVDTTTNYLVYAPFAKPALCDNHLADTIRYSKEFFADRLSLICVDLGIPENLKAVLQKYAAFFKAQERTDRFYKLEIDRWTQEAIEVGLMSVLCRTQALNFEEVLRVVLTGDAFDENKYLAEFRKYDLLDSFWNLVSLYFGYTETEPTLQKLAMTLLVSYAQKEIGKELPKDWSSLISFKTGNIVVFMENIMNNVQYQESYDAMADTLEETLHVKQLLSGMQADYLLECDAFACIDEILLDWITARLAEENVNAALNGMAIPMVCDIRLKKHFGRKYRLDYQLLSRAYDLIREAKYKNNGSADELVNSYCEKDYLRDTSYRKLIYTYDQLKEKERYEELRQLVENIYRNDYLNPICVAWNKGLQDADYTAMRIAPQYRFYNRYLNSKNRAKTVVIISDGMRYEVGAELKDKLQHNENCASVKLESLLSVLPGITSVGMAALLPHKELMIDANNKVLVDGAPSADMKQREAILRKADPDAKCVALDDVRAMNYAALSELFKGTNTCYIYHNQIDNRGEGKFSENEVFNACEEAIDEVYDVIIKLARNKVASHFIVTADHGFMYCRDALLAGQKISANRENTQLVERRCILTGAPEAADGVVHYNLGSMLGCKDERTVSVPVGADVFTCSGGANYVHGGASIQEMLIPVIEVTTKTGKLKKDIQPAAISLVSILNKVTNLITSLDFMQAEPVGDEIGVGTYKIFFVDGDGNKVSSESVLVADSKETDAQKRITRLKFRFKDMQYNPTERFYLVAYEETNEYTPVLRREIRIDMAFANDFGF